MECKPYTLDLWSITSALLRCGFPIHPHRASRTRCGGSSTTAFCQTLPSSIRTPGLPTPPLRLYPTHVIMDRTSLVVIAFLEPELGVCIATALGPILHNQMSTRAQRRRNLSFNEPLLPTGTHFTLMYQQTDNDRRGALLLSHRDPVLDRHLSSTATSPRSCLRKSDQRPHYNAPSGPCNGSIRAYFPTSSYYCTQRYPGSDSARDHAMGV